MQRFNLLPWRAQATMRKRRIALCIAWFVLLAIIAFGGRYYHHWQHTITNVDTEIAALSTSEKQHAFAALHADIRQYAAQANFFDTVIQNSRRHTRVIGHILGYIPHASTLVDAHFSQNEFTVHAVVHKTHVVGDTLDAIQTTPTVDTVRIAALSQTANGYDVVFHGTFSTQEKNNDTP